jgi:radical SAM superfamily enzyme YgiQ (UPF0313 family)
MNRLRVTSYFMLQSIAYRTSASRNHGLRVKLILPALTEATGPFWRPIKYSLFPPLGLATLAAYLRTDDEAEIVDEHVESLHINDNPDVVLIQVYITNAYRAYHIADHYRAKGVFVGVGGLHVTALPEEAALHADAIFLGPAEQTFPQFLGEFREGRPKCVYVSTAGRTLERIPPVRRDLIRRSRYLVPNSIVVTRGCPQHCDFCYKDAFFQGGRGFYTQMVDDAGGNRAAAWPSLVLLRRSLVGRPAICGESI